MTSVPTPDAALAAFGDPVLRASWLVLGEVGTLVLAGVGALVVIGVLLLRRKLQEQTNLIRSQLHLETAMAERYKDLFENATDLVFTIDMQGAFRATNQAARQTFGFFDEEVTCTLRELIVPEDRPVLQDVMALLVGGERSVLRQMTVLLPDGRACVLELNCRVRHVDGCPSSVDVIARDVTQQKREQAALEEARAAAEAASRAKSEFLANMSHEIRTPMNGILGMTELALEGELNSDQRKNLEVVRTSAEALLTIINDILDFSKIEAGRMELERAPFKIASLIEGCLDLVTLPCATKGIELVCDLDPSLPDEWIGDAARLRQVLTNLIGNAAKFTHQGEILVRVERIETPDGKVLGRFTVRDTGIGIPAEHHARIFEMFCQADGSTSRQYGGTGLGLAIASRLVALMGGRLLLDSAPHQGSSFSFTIEIDSRTTHTIVPRNELSGRTALLLEENASCREAIGRILQYAGVQTVDAPPATAIVTSKPAQNETTPVIYLVPAGTTECECPDASAIVRRPVSPRAVLVAFREITRRSDVLALGAVGEGVRPAVLPTPNKRNAAGVTVLLAEDNKVNQMLAVRTLEKGGYKVVVANNGREAVEMMPSVNPDLVLMDIQMPEMDGFQATAKIREWSSIPVIAMTAHALKGDRERCLNGGMTDHISKPVRPAALLELVGRHAGLQGLKN